MRGLLSGKLAKDKIGTEADRRAVANLVAIPFPKGASVVTASGHRGVGAASAATSGVASQGTGIADKLGWSLFGVDEQPEQVAKLLKGWVAVYQRRGLVDALRSDLKLSAEWVPKARFIPPPGPLGKGALDLELQFPAKAVETPPKDPKDKDADKQTPVLFHVLLMPDGTDTWIAFGSSRDNLVRHLAMVKSTASDSGTLAARPGLEPLRSGTSVSSGFITLGAFTYPLANALSGQELGTLPGKAAQSLMTVIQNLPNKGETPVFLASSVTLGPGPKAELAVTMPKAFVEDLGSLVTTGARLALDAGLLPKAGKP